MFEREVRLAASDSGPDFGPNIAHYSKFHLCLSSGISPPYKIAVFSFYKYFTSL